MLVKLLEIKALEKYKLYLKFADDTEGKVDLAHLANKGVFKAWEENDLFSKVYIDQETNAIAWNEMLEICPDNLYLEIKGLTFEEWKKNQVVDATN
jgi:hypothetical protein